MKQFLRTLPLIALLAATPALAEDYVVMKVNNESVNASELQKAWEGFFQPGQAPAFDSIKPDMRDKVLRLVMAEKVLYGEAIKAGAEKAPKFQEQMETVKRKLLVKSYLDSKTGDTVTDADLKKEYNKFVDSLKSEKQIHARHILLSSEEEAKEAKKKLDGGAKFEDVARDLSKDPRSAKNGGDLGTFTRDKMVKEFADAAFAMKKGEISAPVKSSFGWHIIKVEDISKVTPPTFNEVKDQLKGKLQSEKLNDFVKKLVDGAEVKVFDAKGKEVPFNRDPEAAAKEEKKADKPAEKPADTKKAN